MMECPYSCNESVCLFDVCFYLRKILEEIFAEDMTFIVKYGKIDQRYLISLSIGEKNK
jgi:hypothetical protein